MPTLSQITARTRHVSMSWGEIPITFDYHPGRLTGNLIAEVEANPDMKTITNVMLDLIASWDLTEEDGVTMFPLDAERFGEIGLPVLMEMFNAMVGDMRPNGLAPQTRNSKS